MNMDQTFNQGIQAALTCRPGRNITEGIALTVGIPDYERAVVQHRHYCDALRKCGVNVTVLEGNATSPDKCFVSNTAIVTESLAVVGISSDDIAERAKQKDVASALAGTKILKFITTPGILSARDVLQLDGHFYIGLSPQTNQEGAAQLAFFLNEYGYKVTMVVLPETPAVSLNTAATYLGSNRVLIREEIARHPAFAAYEKTIVPYKERGAANAVVANGTLIMAAGYAETLQAVRLLGLPVIEVNISEFEKLGGGLGCLSLCLPKPAGQRETITVPAKRQAAA